MSDDFSPKQLVVNGITIQNPSKGLIEAYENFKADYTPLATASYGAYRSVRPPPTRRRSPSPISPSPTPVKARSQPANTVAAYVHSTVTKSSKNPFGSAKRKKAEIRTDVKGPFLLSSTSSLESILDEISRLIHCHPSDIDIQSCTFRFEKPKSSTPKPFASTAIGLQELHNAVLNFTHNNGSIILALDQPTGTAQSKSRAYIGGDREVSADGPKVCYLATSKEVPKSDLH